MAGKKGPAACYDSARPKGGVNVDRLAADDAYEPL